LIIRQEKPSEFQTIYDLVKVAFQTAKVSNENEQNFVAELRSSGNYIPELALVAEDNAKLVGHIMLTKTCVTMGNSKFNTLLLAPLSVAIEYRKRGIGSQLIVESLKLAKDMGFSAVL
jgi:putative acetyltransferase